MLLIPVFLVAEFGTAITPSFLFVRFPEARTYFILCSAVMATKTLRRSLVDGKTHDRLEASDSDDLNEPLLGGYECSEEIWNDERRREQLHWTLLFTHLIAQWARWLANIVLGSGSLIGRLLASATQNAEMKFRTNGWHVFRTHTSDQTAKPAWNSAEAFRGMHAE